MTDKKLEEVKAAWEKYFETHLKDVDVKNLVALSKEQRDFFVYGEAFIHVDTPPDREDQ